MKTSETKYTDLIFEEESYRNPDNSFYPVYFWMQNAVLSRDEIKKQIDEMYEADIRGICIVPEPASFRPTSMVTELEPDYLTDEFMEYMKYTADYIASKGMVMWLYDEGGWPSGSANGLVAKNCLRCAERCLPLRTLHC